MSSELDILKEMGFSEQRAEKALQVCGSQGVEAAMEWLLAHADEAMDTNEPVPAVNPPATNVPANTEKGDCSDEVAGKTEDSSAGSEPTNAAAPSPEPTSAEGSPASAKSLKCDECGKRFRTEAEVEFHAVKSGHQSFSESAEELKPLTEEEKLEQKKRLEEKIRLRRLEREEKEKKEALEREKMRRKMGQEISSTRQKIEEEEMRKLAEQRRREKMEDKLARQKILEQIERDKLARRQKFDMEPLPATTSQPSPPPQVEAAPKKDYDQCKLQIRLTNGQTLTQTFNAHEELAAVRLYIELNRTDGELPFCLMTNFPRKVFVEEDYVKPLSALGLVPSAVIFLTKAK
uniref:Putative ubx domain protein 1 n=1 Tax=Ixodes ricinus TaxID=34613 RepID=V5HYQ9_IXORI